MNKKGQLTFVIIIVILSILVASYLGYKIVIEKLNYQEICEEKYNQYELEFCAKNIRGIKMCDRANMDFVRIELKPFPSIIYVCINEEGEIHKI